MRGIRLAVEGCGHGKLQDIYSSLEKSCKERDWDSVDLLIIAGDFQSVRNPDDLNVMSVPFKYRKLGDFHEYYSGARVAPYLTLFIGGNHEASSYLRELFYGGWVAPNIYYMGAANILRLGSLRIAGMSGIWKDSDYHMPHTERLPFSRDDIKSVYHVREIDVRKLLQVRTQVDIGISHDWPRAIENHGDLEQLFKIKPFLERSSRDGSLGNPVAAQVMDRLRPLYWFSAHMHCRFSATKRYEMPEGEFSQRKDTVKDDQEVVPRKTEDADISDEVNLDELTNQTKRNPVATDEEKEPGMLKEPFVQAPSSFIQPRPQPKTSAQLIPEAITNTTVRFLALDKCIAGGDFLELYQLDAIQVEDKNLEPQQPMGPESTQTPRLQLQYDPEWLAITRAFSRLDTAEDPDARVPVDLGEHHYFHLIETEKEWVDQNIVQKAKLNIPENFTITAPIHVVGQPELTNAQPDEYSNPQTDAFCALISIDNFCAVSEERSERTLRRVVRSGRERKADRGGARGGRIDGRQG